MKKMEQSKDGKETTAIWMRKRTLPQPDVPCRPVCTQNTMSTKRSRRQYILWHGVHLLLNEEGKCCHSLLNGKNAAPPVWTSLGAFDCMVHDRFLLCEPRQRERRTFFLLAPSRDAILIK